MLKFLKKNWSKVILILLFAVSFFGFLTFEGNLVLKLAAIVLLTIALWRLVSFRKAGWLIVLVLFFSFYSLYSLYFGVNWSLGLIMLGALMVSPGLYWLFSVERNIFTYFYTALLGIIELELFLAFIPWPIDSKGKSLILVAVFVIFEEIVKLKRENKLTTARVIVPIALLVIAMIVVVTTSHWQNY